MHGAPRWILLWHSRISRPRRSEIAGIPEDLWWACPLHGGFQRLRLHVTRIHDVAGLAREPDGIMPLLCCVVSCGEDSWHSTNLRVSQNVQALSRKVYVFDRPVSGDARGWTSRAPNHAGNYLSLSLFSLEIPFFPPSVIVLARKAQFLNPGVLIQ